VKGRAGETAHRTASPIHHCHGDAPVATQGEDVGADVHAYGPEKEVVEVEDGYLAFGWTRGDPGLVAGASSLRETKYESFAVLGDLAPVSVHDFVAHKNGLVT
jgi:hypothetical protein